MKPYVNALMGNKSKYFEKIRENDFTEKIHKNVLEIGKILTFLRRNLNVILNPNEQSLIWKNYLYAFDYK